MDFLLQITATGDTTAREISVASQQVRDVLERLAGVDRIEPQHALIPVHAKSGLVEALGGFAVSVVPDVLKGVLQALQAVLSRQPAATKVAIKIKDGEFNFEFDPKKISLQDLVNAAERLCRAAPGV